MSNPGEQTRNRALMRGAAAFELLMLECGTELRPAEDSDRVDYLSGELTAATREARAAGAQTRQEVADGG